MSDPRQPGCAPATSRAGSALGTVALLFVLSLAVRLALWVPVVHFKTLPLYDEVSYCRRALAYENLVECYVRGGLFWAHPSEEDLEQAYLQGIWPPLHPLLIGLVFAVVGHSLAVARLVVVVQSAATTCVVFALTSRLAGRRAGLTAAGIHIIYPSFLAYSHLLWSETSYILACLGGLYFAVRLVDENRPRRLVVFSLLCGACLGLAGLARAAALPLMAAVPLWLLWRGRGRIRRWLVPLVVLGASGLVVLPWQMTLWASEQRFTLLSTSAGYNLYLGNNPWIGAGDDASKVRAEMGEYARQHDVSRDEAGRALAGAYIRADLAGFAIRCLDRARSLWGLDWYVVRHLIHAIYPPLPHSVLIGLVLLFAVSFVLLAACVVYGMCSRAAGLRHRSLLLGCVLFSMIPNVLCIANSRMTLPLLAILLPAGGAGLAALVRQRAWIKGAGLIGLMAVGSWALNPRLPRAALGIEGEASAYYGSFVGQLERVLGATHVSLLDRVYLRYAGQQSETSLGVTLMSDAYRIEGPDARSLAIRNMRPGNTYRLVLRAPEAVPDPPVLELRNLRSGRSVRIRPVQRDAWRQWRPTGLANIEYYWAGTRGTAKPPDWMF